MSKHLRNTYERVFRWGQQHTMRVWFLCCGFIGSGPVLIGVLSIIDSLFNYHARVRIVYHAFGVGFSIDDLVGIGLFCSGILTSLLNIPAVILALLLYRIDKSDERQRERALRWYDFVQEFSLPFLLIVSCLLVGGGVMFSVLIVAGFLAGPPGSPL